MTQQQYSHQLQPHAHPYITPQSATNPNHDSYPKFPSRQANQNLTLTPISAVPPASSISMNGQSTYYSTSESNTNRQPTSSPRPARAIMNPSQPSHSQASERSLPSLTFSGDQEFEDAYVQFILYCNPAIPHDVNTQDLRKNFAAPPRSDQKTFSTKKLFELLQQLDRKELKTWTELALKLGVEKPAIDKGQSSQKVQQYSVRLKRWLRASHIDAFFDYMMNKPHKYMELPTEDFPDQRDGVFAEDDLALRALKPEFRPKRGRKRAESDEMEPMSAIEPKRPHLDTAFNNSAYPHSAHPASMSAHPDDMERFHDQWATPTTAAPTSAVPKSGSTTMRWRLNETPSTPHPLSAVTPLSAQPPDSAFDDPGSASQSQKMRMRRRHGTAVSSAWPSNSTTPNGKLRGRPPTNRSVKDGPFISFPANPKAKEGPPIDLSRNQVSTPTEESRSLTQSAPPPSQTPDSPFRVPAYPTPISATAKVPGRPERLSLQVPQHVGNPVRLVTPTVVLNGSHDQDLRRPASSNVLGSAFSQATPSSSFTPISNEDMKRALSADLLKADVTGRVKALRGTEAKDLAESLLTTLRPRSSTSPLHDPGTAEEMYKPAFASWLGLNPLPTSTTQAWSPVSSSGVKKIHVRRFRVSTEGYDIPIDDSDDEDTEARPSSVKETFDIDWELSLGGLSGRFQIKGLVIGKVLEDNVRALGDAQRATVNQAATWEQRVTELEVKLKQRNEEYEALKDKVLEAVL